MYHSSVRTRTRWLIDVLFRVKVAKLKRMRTNIEELDVMNRQLGLLRSFQVWISVSCAPADSTLHVGLRAHALFPIGRPPGVRRRWSG